MEQVADIELREDAGVALTEIAQGLAHELHPRRRTALRAGLNSSLERDWGFDSLSRAELLLRVERAFSVHLPEQLLSEAETLKDLLSALAGARRLSSLDATARHIIAEETAEPAPAEATTLTEVLDWHVLRHGDRVHVVLWHGDGEETKPHLSTRRRAGPGGSKWLAASRAAAGRAGGNHAADERSLLCGVFRRALCRRRADADLPAGTAVTDRGASQAAGRDSSQRTGGAADRRARSVGR